METEIERYERLDKEVKELDKKYIAYQEARTLALTYSDDIVFQKNQEIKKKEWLDAVIKLGHRK